MAQTVPMTERALIQRINRKLHADGAKLRTAQGLAEAAMGRFYTVSLRKNCVLQRSAASSGCSPRTSALEQ